MTYTPREIEYTQSALLNAFFSGLSFEDVLECVTYAADCKSFDEAVNLMTLAKKDDEDG